ncbi:hypothetical protein ACVNF4_01920 [Streptomyces sp. S6]
MNKTFMQGAVITHDPYFRSRTWRDLDPARHPFDPKSASVMVSEIVFSRGPQESISEGLGRCFGDWAYWAVDAFDESPYSGSVIRDIPTRSGDPEQMAQRYTSVLLQWRGWLEELAAAFASSAPPPGADEDEIRRTRAHAVAPLVTLVVERTGAGELWRAPCADAIAWYLESTGMPADKAEELADEVVDSEFESWISPDAEAVGRVRSAIEDHGA